MQPSHAVAPLDSLSLTRLRQRQARFWLVAISLISFASLYVTPLVAALRLPAVAQETTPLPLLAVPQVAFPSLGVPKLRSAPTGAAVSPATRPEQRRAAAPGQPRVVPASAPAATRAGATSAQVPVVENSYSLTPTTATDAGQSPAKEAKDPFANVPVVDNTIGGTPPPSQAADVVPEPTPVAIPMPGAPAAPAAPEAEQPTRPTVEVAETPSAPLEGYRLTSSLESETSQQSSEAAAPEASTSAEPSAATESSTQAEATADDAAASSASLDAAAPAEPAAEPAQAPDEATETTADEATVATDETTAAADEATAPAADEATAASDESSATAAAVTDAAASAATSPSSSASTSTSGASSKETATTSSTGPAAATSVAPTAASSASADQESTGADEPITTSSTTAGGSDSSATEPAAASSAASTSTTPTGDPASAAASTGAASNDSTDSTLSSAASELATAASAPVASPTEHPTAAAAPVGEAATSDTATPISSDFESISSASESATTAPAEAAPAPAAATATAWEIVLTGGSLVTISLAGGLLGVTVAGVTESQALSSVLQLAIVGSEGADTFELGIGVPELTVPIRIDGRGGADRIRGPPATLTWTLTGPGTGTVGSVSFTGVEDVEGDVGNEDTFVFEAAGTLVGTVDGGAGGFDTLVVVGNYETVRSTPTGPSSGTLTLDGRLIRYAGLEPIAAAGTATNVIFDLPGTADAATLAPEGTGLRLSGATFELTDFAIPTGSLTINGGGGDDTITLTGLLDLLAASLIINAERILVAAGAVVTTSGDVTLAASAQNAGPSALETLTAEAIVEGDIDADGAVAITAEVQQTVTLTAQTLTTQLSFTGSSTATAELRATAVVSGATLVLAARTTTSFTWHGSAPPTTVYDVLSFPGGGSVAVSVTNVMRAGITGGARAAVGSGPISPTDSASLAIEATDDTTIDVEITDPSTPASAASLSAAIGDNLPFDRLSASTSLSRDTRAYVEDEPAAGVTIFADGDARVSAVNLGTVTLEIVSDFVGASSNSVAKDDAVAAVEDATVDAAGLQVVARNGTSYSATGKDVENVVKGTTQAAVASTTVGAAGDVTLTARDDSALTVLSHDLVLVPGTPFVTLAGAVARNDLERTIAATIEGSGITTGGDLGVAATGNAAVVSTVRAVSVKDKSSHFGVVPVADVVSAALAATLALNVIRGGVNAHITDSTIAADNVTVHARTEQAIVDAIAEVSAYAATPADEIAIASPSLTIGAALALNFIGWNVTADTVAGIALATVDAVLGTEFGGGPAPWLVVAFIQDTVVTAEGDLAVSAESAPLINATVTNAASSTSANMYLAASAGAGAIVASNKVASGAEAWIRFTGALPGTISAGGDVTVEAVDDAGIYANAKLVVSSTTTSDGGVHFFQQGVNSAVHADFTSSQGSQAIDFGDRVRLAPAFASPSFTAAHLRQPGPLGRPQHRRRARQPLRRRPAHHRLGDQAPRQGRPDTRGRGLRGRRRCRRDLQVRRAERPVRPGRSGLLRTAPAGCPSAATPRAPTATWGRRPRST